MTMPVMCSRLLRANLFAWIYMYLFHVCFTGLHLVSLWLQDVHLRFILDVYLKKTETTKNYKHYTAGFQLPTSTLVFTVGAWDIRFSIYILLVIPPGWRRAMLVRNPRRGIIGPSERFYQVFAAPQHRHLFTGILSFLTDSSGAFTEDIVSFHCVRHSCVFGPAFSEG